MREQIKGVRIEQIIEKYNELGSVWKVGEVYGIAGQAVYDELKERGIVKHRQTFSEDDKRVLIEKYPSYRIQGRLQELANELGRTKQFICREARKYGLTSRDIKFQYSDEKRKQLSLRSKNQIKKYGHPRGALGLKHTDSAKKRMGDASREAWREHRDDWLNDERIRKLSDRAMEMNNSGIIPVRSRGYFANVTVGGKSFIAKSSWEYNMALYLNYLKNIGLINDWEYEPTRFVFKYNTSGVRSYKPDFSVIKGDDIYYIEVKGWQDKKYEIKKKLMKNEFPDVRIIYIKENEYKLIRKKYGKKLNGWDSLKDISLKPIRRCSIAGCDNPVHSKGLCRHHFYIKYKQ